MSKESEQFGQRRPPLSVTIKGILERYPDGQIFKEMIQNADDAGAKTVWFYVDERQHGTSNLPHPDLARFQGPALVAANDACFTEEDWEGIQSLQQSVKAEDPFKVGRFGIGFNSVYHLTDLPVIVSGNRLACFEPQEKMWRGESGQAFKLSDLISQSSDFIAPLNGLAGFNSRSVRYGGYSQTIFRLPLRREASGLSSNIYNTQKLQELLDALREEAKYLLLFLKSVCKIQVVHISQYGQHSTSFCVEIAPGSLATVSAKRDSFMQQLKQAHAMQPYQITNVISFTAKFSVVVTDNNPRRNQTGASNWLIANCVGSAEYSVQAAAAKQRTFPWVGGALELGGSSAGGRIFCFLPMPVEAASGLPIHVNGTFGLNDERRSLKWPGIERRNDPTANWNKILVSQLLPPCYAMLLTESKKHISPEQFYRAWPDVQAVKGTQFSEILQPLFTALFRQAVVWTEKTEALQQVGNWILISQATFISEGSSLASVMKKVLSSCGVQLVTVPAVIWRAIQFARVGISEVSPKLARSNMRSYPNSYSNIDQYSKRVILGYCLSDSCYNDLNGLSLLPLANGNFTDFANYYGDRVQAVYLCSDDCPRSLLPTLDHLLVDLSNDPSLQMALYQVAASQQTKLKVLTEREVATLLSQAMPSNCRSSSLVSMPHSQLPSTWLQTFWKWLKSKNLKLFNNHLLVPCYSSTSHSASSFYLARLNSGQPVVYVSSYASCPSSLLSALYKMNVRVCLQSEFSFVQHRQLSSLIKQFDTNSVLDTTHSQSNYKSKAFTPEEANSLRTFLISGTYTPSSTRRAVLQNLAIFSSASNSLDQLHSINSAALQSVTRQTLGEPSNCAISVSNLPPNLILLSRGNYHQLQLLQNLQIPFPSDYTLLVSHVFPLIRGRTFPDHLIDNLMAEVLDMFQVLNSRQFGSILSENLKSLPFVKTVYGRKTPAELFTPYNTDIAALYSGEDVFPQSPYNTPQRIQVLISCGLQTTVTPQQVLDIVYSISSPASSYPQQVDSTKLSRAKAVLEYISTPSFHRQTGGYYTSPIFWGNYSFSNALQQLATNRYWLPVLSSKPTDYCDELSWKGSGYNSHFISLNSSVVVLSSSTASTLPHLVGSQMYLISPTVSPQIAAMLPTDSASIAQHVVAHFKMILAHKDRLSVEVMDSLIHRVYRYMNSKGASSLRQLYSIEEWIYIKRKNKLVAPAVVALKQNRKFRQDLEPYIYILPDSLLQYSTLFGVASKVSQIVTQTQILSILKTIRDNVQARAPQTTHQEAWSTVTSILNWLTNNGTQSVPDDIAKEDVLVPVESQSQWPQLVQASDVVYTDNEFLKKYLQDSEEKESHTFVHAPISAQLAHLLNVTPLSEELDISEDTFEDAGQHEPLTTRLKNILRDYKDGLTIIKELLQNADDAEATEVNICYDSRQHERDPKKLFFSGVSEAHGPALIVHNDRTFSDDDFKNITKLAGATKQGKALKIGKFGVGFCSVYHMTDAPSFISREYFYIFDPTLLYLKKEVKNPAQPGKKTRFTHKFISRSKQLDPYNGLFGFDRTRGYQGTIFRLPFRTHASELSGTCYTEATIRELISAIKESSTNLLLFLQHVRTITFQRIDQGQTTPQVLLKISRENVSPSLPLSKGIEIRNLSCTSSSGGTSSCQWLVSQSNEYSQQEYYTASVATPLGASNYNVNAKFEGEIFCFLPLSQKTGLPVHVSSNFAVINNRRGIWTSDEATSQSYREVAWNITLMQGVIANAYHALLVALKEMARNGFLSKYTFHDLWPKTDKLLQRNPWAYMVTQLYQLIASDQLFYSAYRKQWLYLKQSKFLTPGILCQSSEQLSTPECVFKVLQYLNIPIVDLPISYHTYFSLANVTINESEFTKLFFTNLDALVSILTTRSEVIQYMLEVYAAEYDDGTTRNYTLDGYLQSYACIPCTPNGKILRKCTDIVDSTADFAGLFDSSEGRFPLRQFLDRHLSYTALGDLGMISEAIPYDVLVERAQTIKGLHKLDKAKALKRVKLILFSCAKIEKSEPVHSKKGKTAKQKQVQKVNRVELSFIPFLPVLPRLLGYHLPWKGDDCELACGKDLVIEGRSGRYIESVNPDLAGSQVVIVNERSIDEGGCGYIGQDTIALLKIRRSPNVQEVVAHLTVVQQVFLSQPATKELVSVTDRMCRQIYGFLDDMLKPEIEYHRYTKAPVTKELDPSIVPCLQGISCVWTGEQFVAVELIARELWSNDGPYLYRLPTSLSYRKNLTKILKIREKFDFSDVQKALHKMKQDFKDQPVNERCQNILKDIISFLQKLPLSVSETHILMLPDEHYVLHQSNKLAYNDVDWAPRDPRNNYVHDIVPSQLAKTLQVQPARSKILEKFINSSSQFKSIEFGQREELTLRIQNILRDYPFDITILKELLQNADDAKATKMYFILDKRTHGSQGILSKNWEKLQGPALLVWNDSEFSEDDLKGIQELGMGSKRSDAETIGQYGIGFNVVYHLTDCPSFITGGETMCVLDPHCEYVHEANKLFPGRRFDGLKDGFWESFPDMRSSYLQSGLDSCPPELQGGSLFRFPLRTTKHHLKNSRIIQRDKQGEPITMAITSTDMFRMLYLWAPKMKEAMLFLNHIKELQFIVIEEKSKQLEITKKFCTQVDDSALEDRKILHDVLSNFTSKQGNRSVVIRYPLTISDVYCLSSGREVSTEEKWLIQQGVGDIDNEQQVWSFIDTVKPRHGIAAPILSPQKPHVADSILTKAEAFSDKEKFEGNVFCFLPLPVSSKLPVHINGNFILNSSRRNLWVSTETGREDDRSMWNIRLFQAIASSYADFLVHARSFYMSARPYKTWATVNNDISQYYDIFPHTSDLEKSEYKAIAKSVYEKLVEKNVEILAVVSKEESSALLTGSKTHETSLSKQASKVLVIEWHPPKSRYPSTQVYFWEYLASVTDWKDIKNFLEDLGMKLTAASGFLQGHLNEAIKEQDNKLKSTSPGAVFEYYCKFCAQASRTGHFPCAINESVFRSVATFKKFTEYLLTVPPSHKPDPASHLIMISVETLTFPKEPFGHPLLLTADNQLRRFQENAKVISSSYPHLFPKCLESFLHPDMAKLSYSSNYFVACSPFSDNTYALSLVERLIAQHLPQCLRTNRVAQFPPGLSEKKLKEYWKCFQHCSVFQSILPELLKQWAFLPCTSGSLHSYSDTLVPVVVPLIKQENAEKIESVVNQIYEVLRVISVPFLNTLVTECIPNSCPKVEDRFAILKTLFHLSQEKDLSGILGRRASTVISYLTKIDFRQDEDNLRYVKSLPLFECIDGVFRAIVGKTTYIWPSDVSVIGYSDWIKCVPSVLFLKDCGASWKHLGGSEVFGISPLTAEELYCQYIFSNFSALSESNRYEHLTHIKDTLFLRNTMYKNSDSKYDVDNRRRAVNFLRNLTDLHCIGEENLRPINDFCNHEVPIFATFDKHFSFLPQFFKSSWDKWIDFLKELGLKCTVTKKEFEDFCSETADGKHEDPVKASRVLLESLCSEIAKEAGWHKDHFFLQKVGDIPFVPIQHLPEITWIRNAQCGSNNLVVGGKKLLSLAKLNKAAIPEYAVYLWTVKPIVKLPASILPRYIPEHLLLAESLGITCKPAVTDVINNIRNITASKRFTDFQHFDQYPNSNKPPDTPGTKSLMSVMVEILTFLDKKSSDLTDAHIQLLQGTPCIPVYSTFDGTHSWQVVLVEPCCVLRSGAITTNKYHPYLHQLDYELSRLNHLLELIGVESTINFSHVQYALKKAYDSSTGQQLNHKAKGCVFAILRYLIELFRWPLDPSSEVVRKRSFDETGEILSPLYLPNKEGKLALSTTLLYVDNDNFKGNLRPQLEGTGYSLLTIRSIEYDILTVEKDFCELLPKAIRPIGLSTLCSQTVLPECKRTPHTDIGDALVETFDMEKTLSNAVSACVNHYCTKAQPPLENVAAIALEFFNCTEIQTVNHLRLSVQFKQTNQMLGELDTKFHLAIPDDPSKGCLYLDSQLTTNSRSRIFSKIIAALSVRLMRLLRTRITHPQLITGTAHDNLLKVFSELLTAKCSQEVKEILDENEILLAGEGMDDITFKLGREVPECWHHRLDQTVENVFHPGEVVGYELMEDHIIFAMIMHPVLPEGTESFDEIPRVSMKYMILTSRENEEGSEVSVLKLYKFLTGLKKPKQGTEGETNLVPYEGESEATQLQQELQSEHLQEICADLKRQLEEMWNLPEEERKKAIRRLCLKWHPDKNPDKPVLAEEVFKFLNAEISKRNARGDVHWEDLQRTARQQRQYYEREQSSARSPGGGDFGSSGWGGASAESFNDDNIRPEKDRDEGRRWVKQAQANFNSLLLLHSGSKNDLKVCGDVCFMAHQVAEKALKGGKYFVCGLDANSLVSHNLSTHAYGLQSECPGETHGLAAHTTPLENYYLDPRYPNRWPPGVVPADRYSYEQAEAAKNHAQAILEIVKNIVENDPEE